MLVSDLKKTNWNTENKKLKNQKTNRRNSSLSAEVISFSRCFPSTKFVTGSIR